MIFVIAVAVVLALHASQVMGQPYPSRPVRVIVPYQAGGGADNAARGVAEFLSPMLGQPVVIDNRAGANGLIGMDACAKAAPDGHTLCITSTSPISQHPWLVANLPYDPPRDFAPIIQLGVQPGALVVHPSVPAGSVRELLALAKAKPDSIGWASSGNGSPGHLYHEWLKSVQVPFFHVPYKTLDQALIGAINGDVQVLVHALAAVMPQVKAGKLKLLAAGMDKRTLTLPEVPSAKEGGLEAASALWIGAFAPARTPREIIARLNADMEKVLAGPEARRVLGLRGIEPVGGTAEQFAEFLKADRELTGRLVTLAGMKPQ